MARKRKIYREGDRITFYLKKGFPKEMLDWINGQSDLQLLQEYALEKLFKEVGLIDIASVLPRTYEIGKGSNSIIQSSSEAAISIQPPIKENQEESIPEAQIHKEQDHHFNSKAMEISFSDEEPLNEFQDERIYSEEPIQDKKEPVISEVEEKKPTAETLYSELEEDSKKPTPKKKNAWAGLALDDSNFM